MQGKEILRLVNGLHRNKEIEQEVIFQAIESALQSAARKCFGSEEDVAVHIDRTTGDIAAVHGQDRIEPEMLGRIAAQTAKQIIVQRIREAESQTIYEEYCQLVGTLTTGSVQRFEGGTIVVGLPRTEALLPRSEQIPGEHYQAGERVRAVILDVRQQNNLVRIFLSRANPQLIHRLFELEVPEVAEGVVQIRKIAREPGLRTKIAVESLDPRVDCIGACVGVRGTRIKSIIDEVKGEKIDIIPWTEAPETLIADSLRPAEILQITLEEGETTKRAIVTVPEDQVSLAIGWKGQNVRLAVKMTGWDIDIVAPEPLEGEAPEDEEPVEEPVGEQAAASSDAARRAPEGEAPQDAAGAGVPTEEVPPPQADTRLDVPAQADGAADAGTAEPSVDGEAAHESGESTPHRQDAADVEESAEEGPAPAHEAAGLGPAGARLANENTAAESDGGSAANERSFTGDGIEDAGGSAREHGLSDDPQDPAVG
jgi:N utilization substance protein A